MSVVLGIAEEKVHTNREVRYYFFDDASGNKEIKYIEIDDKIENDMPKNTISHAHENLVPNPSFEEGDTTPTGWTSIALADYTHTWDSSVAHSGEKSIGCLLRTNYTENDAWETTDYIPVDFTNHIYGFSFWYKFIGTQPSTEQYVESIIYYYDENLKKITGFGFGESFSSEWAYMFFPPDFLLSNNEKDRAKYAKIQLGQNVIQGEEPDPMLEVRFDDIYFGFDEPPHTPTITGKTYGSTNRTYRYTIQTTDPENDNVYYFVDWGDMYATGLIGPYKSGQTVSVWSYWKSEGTYTITVHAIDVFGLSSQTTLNVTMPYSYNKPIPQFLEILAQRFPNAFPMLRHLLRY